MDSIEFVRCKLNKVENYHLTEDELCELLEEFAKEKLKNIIEIMGEFYAS